MIIAIDGPAGSGKSTVARLLAKRLGFTYIDTGAMYRAITLKTINNKIDVNDSSSVIDIAKNTKIDLINDSDNGIKVIMDGFDVSLQIRQPEITKIVSVISKIPKVRSIMLTLQRALGERNDSVLEGRDIGTVVFPNAERKFYLDASFDERVNRRFKEMRSSNLNISKKEVALDLQNRDKIDSTREIAPLKKADDAILIDTTDLTIEQVVDKLHKLSHP
jgi:cytidylate kinase